MGLMKNKFPLTLDSGNVVYAFFCKHPQCMNEINGDSFPLPYVGSTKPPVEFRIHTHINEIFLHDNEEKVIKKKQKKWHQSKQCPRH